MADAFFYDSGERSQYRCLGEEIQIEHIKAYICKPSFFTDKAVIVIHDIFGWLFPDTRYIVDLVALQGYIAICPDFLKGKEPWKTTDHWADFADWMKDHDPMKVDREADVVLKYLKEQCGAKKIGIIRDSEERYNLLNPTFFIFGEKDHTISYDQITLLEEKLKQYCKVAYKIKVYPGQVHGFAQLKPEDMKPQDKPYIEEARQDMIDWIKMYI
ncbi:carboxymethylenebutenolidase homolog isoform X2 [Struthio camelus]|uniref:carboxymethylenebutenolidase homolog isoform X2 n=1 Tax=Struthio camelus TaxID=8801 RepID=UPI003603BCFD